MADFTQIIQEINDDINTNGVGAITGAKLNEVLRDMIAAVNAAKTDILPDGALYGGFAWPNEPPTYGDDHRYFYLAFLAGSYPAFDTELTGNILAMFYWLEDAQEWTSNNLTMTPTGIEDLLSPKMDTVELYTQLGFLRFSPYSTYSVGDYVVNEGFLYVFTSNHPAGQWDEDDVAEANLLDYITDYVSKQLSGKQDTISDLATIRSGAAAGATAYQKPSGGIPKTDLASGVQTSLGKADTAVQQVTVGTTTTGNAGTNASVTNSGTSTAPVLDFTIPRGADGADGQDGADAVNPFKGWWPDLAALKAAHTATAGDSAYVKDASPATTWSIYIYDSTASSNNYWADSGTDADTSNVQTFESGQEVNETYIDDTHLINPNINSIAKAVDVNNLNKQTIDTLGNSRTVSLNLETGGINPDNGNNIIVSNRLRATNYIAAEYIIVNMSVDGDMFYLFGYKNDGTFVGSIGWQQNGGALHIDGADKYRIVFGNNTLFPSSSTPITPEDFVDLGISVSLVTALVNEDDVGVYDFAITDENKNIIVAFKDGHIKTKNFNSKDIEPIRIESINQTSIPSCLSKLAKIENGNNAVLNLGIVGDSWTQGVGTESIYTMNRITYVKFLTRILWQKYGYAGLGWFDFGYSNSDMKCADDTCISLEKSGTINYVTRTSSSLGIARSHAVFSNGSSYTLALVDSNRPIDKAVVWFYNNAAFTYQVNDGESVQVTASSSDGWQSVVINGNITKIKITATANSTIIFGIDFSYGNKGVKVHKLGNRAATSTDFVEGNAESWEEGISKLNLDILAETLYTNDRWIDNVNPVVVVNNIKELFNRFKSVAPNSDVVCIAPCENYEAGVHPYTTNEYASAIFDFCSANSYPFINLIPLFGSKEQVQALGLFYDNLHPNLAGANLIGNYLFKQLFNIYE